MKGKAGMQREQALEAHARDAAIASERVFDRDTGNRHMGLSRLRDHQDARKRQTPIGVERFMAIRATERTRPIPRMLP